MHENERIRWLFIIANFCTLLDSVSRDPKESPRRRLYYCFKDTIHLIDLETGKDYVIAGGGEKSTGSKEHFLAKEAALDGPFSLVFDQDSNVFFLDDHGTNIHRIDIKTRSVRYLVPISNLIRQWICNLSIFMI